MNKKNNKYDILNFNYYSCSSKFIIFWILTIKIISFNFINNIIYMIMNKF